LSLYDQFIEKHRANGLLIDTNLLLLYLVGRTNKNRIQTFKRTQQYTIDDFDLLEILVSRFATLITTPHLLTELSNLATLQGTERSRLNALFKQIVEQTQEFYDESRRIVSDAAFNRLGLADAAITTLCRRNVLVLTDDLALYLGLTERGVDVINFNHIRTFFWRH
jgi:hypothetical protein